MIKYNNIVIVFFAIILTTFVLVQCVFAQSNHPMSLKDQTITLESIPGIVGYDQPTSRTVFLNKKHKYTEKDLWALASKVDSISILYIHKHSDKWSIHIDNACGISGLNLKERGNDLDELINRTLTKYYNEVCCK